MEEEPDPDSYIVQIITLGVLMFFSAFFSASETALTSLNSIKVLAMVKDGKKGAKYVEKITMKPEKMLSAVLIGNNIANIATSTISAAVAIRLVGDGGIMLGITTVIVTFLILVFCEITPKTLAVRKADEIARIVALPMLFFVTIFTPVSALIQHIVKALFFVLRIKPKADDYPVTKTELKAMLEMSHRQGVLQESESEMITDLVDFDDIRAKDVMVPRTEVVAVPLDMSYRKVMQVFSEEHFSRLPVFKDNADQIVGILYLKDLVFLEHKKRAAFKIEDYMRKPFFSYESKKISSLLTEMRGAGIGLAVIIDEYGGTSGIAAMEDLIEQIVGDIQDEYDETAPDGEKLSENEFNVDGGLKLDDFNDLTGAGIESEDYESIGGYVIGELGDIPAIGTVINIGNLSFRVEAVGKNRIERLLVIKKT